MADALRKGEEGRHLPGGPSGKGPHRLSEGPLGVSLLGRWGAGTGSHQLPFSPASSQGVFQAPLPTHHPPLLWHGPRATEVSSNPGQAKRPSRAQLPTEVSCWFWDWDYRQNL